MHVPRTAGPTRWLALAAVLLPLLGTAPAQAAAGAPTRNIAWLRAAADADIDRAFARARSENKPLLLYWGASWCPPCLQLKVTLFNRQDFAVQARSFVAVEIDGAQKLGTRFNVRGYPTLILMSPAGAEITRLPNEAEPEQVMAALQAGMAGGRPVKAVLADAQAGKRLSADEWRVLGFYGWAGDEAALAPRADRPKLLADLAARAPDPETSQRLMLKALVENDGGAAVRPDPAQRDAVAALLADPARARLHMDVLVNGAAELLNSLAPADSADRAAWAGRLDAALVRLQADPSLSRGDRLSALIGRVEIARGAQPEDLLQPTLPPTLTDEVRAFSARMDREITDPYERQAVLTGVAYGLGRTGLWAESDALLKASLARTPSPYYLMSQLGTNARKQGRKDEALQWYAKSFDTSQGPATRLQWGAGYVAALVDLAPADAARIEKTAARLIDEAAADPGSFYERSGRSMQRLSNKLLAWNRDGQHAATLKRLQVRLDGVCRKLPEGAAPRTTCEGLLKAPVASAG